jgi:hypothetical protein
MAVNPQEQGFFSARQRVIAEIAARQGMSVSVEEREAFHRVTCLNSRADEDMTLVQGIAERISTALEKAGIS